MTKAQKIGYWVCTGLIGFAFLSGGVVDVLQPAEAVQGMTHLGYPLYFMTIIGVWKVLGAIAILAPGLPLIKEWAYAGIVFDLTGAAASHAAVGDGAADILTPLVMTAMAVASWYLRPESRRLKRT